MDEIAVEVGFQAIQRTNTARPPEQLAAWQDAGRAFVEEYRNSLLEHPNVLPLLVGTLAARIQARQLVGLGEGATTARRTSARRVRAKSKTVG
jgi:hypothetical protein